VHDCKGENAWQENAALYSAETNDPLALQAFVLLEGQPLSYNNWCDVDRLLATMTHIVAAIERLTGRPNDQAVVLGAKHGNCCGMGVKEQFLSAIRKMLVGDPLAIFGGVVMVNFIVDQDKADELVHYGMHGGRRLLDCVVAAGFTEKAVEILARKGGKCRLLANPALESLSSKHLDAAPKMRHVRGGMLVQSPYAFVLDVTADYVSKTKLANIKTELDLVLAWAVGSTSNSNTITLVRDGMLLGNGVGQQDRVGAAELAIERALRSKHTTTGAAAYSDSFFPFPDGMETLLDASVAAVFASSGSVNDDKVRQVCIDRHVPFYSAPDHICRGFFGH